MAAETSKTSYQPGDAVPRSGIYRVIHGTHRASHENSFVRSEKFPPCQTCGASVKFEFVQGEAQPEGREQDKPRA